VLITGDKIYVVSNIPLIQQAKHLTVTRYQANAGDSRCVLSVKGEVKPLSNDQKPSEQGPSYSISHSEWLLTLFLQLRKIGFPVQVAISRITV
jgi:serine/threonine protein phosphatase PrpC